MATTKGALPSAVRGDGLDDAYGDRWTRTAGSPDRGDDLCRQLFQLY